MTPPPITTRGKSILTTLLLLLLTNLPQTTRSMPCGNTSSTANHLATAIAQSAEDPQTISWHVHVTIPATISGEDDDERSSFDAPSILVNDAESDEETLSLVAVFHSQVGRVTEKATYAARTTVPRGSLPSAENGWEITAKLSDSGSMGHLHLMADGRVFFVYEYHDYEMGNTLGVRLYDDLATLQAGGGWKREVRLLRDIALPAAGDTVTTERYTVRNIGTPTITDVVENDVGTIINFRFHYFPEGGSLDYPGVGYVLFPPSGQNSAIVSEYDLWYGRFENKVNNAMRIADVVGKVGQRAALGSKYLLYEGQMASAGEDYIGWLSWRPILYELGCDNPVGAVLPLTLPTDLQTLANPHVTVMEGGYVLFSFFVPSEVFDESLTETYEFYDPSLCPSCAANPMEVAKAPARSGTVLVLLNLIGAGKFI